MEDSYFIPNFHLETALIYPLQKYVIIIILCNDYVINQIRSETHSIKKS